jgi:hypothetical protein
MRDLRTPKKRYADALLRAAKYWQNCMFATDAMGGLPACVRDVLDDTPDGEGTGWRRFDPTISAALSEAAGMGFDLETVK